MASANERVAVPVMGRVEDIDMLMNRNFGYGMVDPFDLT
jgi:hypothetical protein